MRLHLTPRTWHLALMLCLTLGTPHLAPWAQAAGPGGGSGPIVGGGSSITVAGTLGGLTNGASTWGFTNASSGTVLTSAKSNASTGKLIVVAPGNYTNGVTTLATNGINWLLLPGVIISNSGNSSMPPFSDEDAAGGNAFAVTSYVSGAGATLSYSNGTLGAGPSGYAAVNVAHPLSRMTLELGEILIAPGVAAAGVLSSNGYLNVRAGNVRGGAYSPAWFYGGTMHTFFDEMSSDAGTGGGGLLLVDTVAPNNNTNIHHWYHTGNSAIGSNGIPVFASGPQGTIPNYRIWVDQKQGVTDGVNAIDHLSSFLYWHGQKLESTKTNVNTGSGAALLRGGMSWGSLDKLSSAGGYNFFISGGTNMWDVDQIEDTANAAGLIAHTGGNSRIRGVIGKLKGNVTNAFGINHTGGTLEVGGMTIDSSSNTGTNPPVQVSGSGLTLKNMEINGNAAQTYSIFAGSAQTIAISGMVKANKPFSPLVTLSGGLFADVSSNSLYSPLSLIITNGNTNAPAIEIGSLTSHGSNDVFVLRNAGTANFKIGGRGQISQPGAVTNKVGSDANVVSATHYAQGRLTVANDGAGLSFISASSDLLLAGSVTSGTTNANTGARMIVGGGTLVRGGATKIYTNAEITGSVSITNSIATYATNRTTITATGYTNTLTINGEAVNVTVYCTYSTATLFDSAGNSLHAFAASTADATIRMKPNWRLVGTTMAGDVIAE